MEAELDDRAPLLGAYADDELFALPRSKIPNPHLMSLSTAPPSPPQTPTKPISQLHPSKHKPLSLSQLTSQFESQFGFLVLITIIGLMLGTLIVIVLVAVSSSNSSPTHTAQELEIDTAKLTQLNDFHEHVKLGSSNLRMIVDRASALNGAAMQAYRRQASRLIQALDSWSSLDNTSKISLMRAIDAQLSEGRKLETQIANLLPTLPSSNPKHLDNAVANPSTEITSTNNNNPTASPPPAQFPRTIHMTWVHHNISDLGEKIGTAVQSWITMNPGWEVKLWDDCDIFKFMREENQEYMAEFLALSPVERTDLFRYLVLFRRGGVYTDVDTVCLKPIDEWDNTHKVAAIIGLEANFPTFEFARRIGAPRQIQFCQWTLVSRPGHPIMEEVAKRILKHPGDHSHDGNDEVMETTGPGIWTDTVTWFLNSYTLQPNDVVEGRIVGDVKFLNIQGFGNTQGHSNAHSWNDPRIKDEAFVHHLFLGSWRKHPRSSELVCD